jgi:hypothetical protein
VQHGLVLALDAHVVNAMALPSFEIMPGIDGNP